MMPTTKNIDTNRKLRQIMAERIWLDYFNKYLYDHGVITQRAYRQMTVLIIERTARMKKE